MMGGCAHTVQPPEHADFMLPWKPPSASQFLRVATDQVHIPTKRGRYAATRRKFTGSRTNTRFFLTLAYTILASPSGGRLEFRSSLSNVIVSLVYYSDYGRQRGSDSVIVDVDTTTPNCTLRRVFPGWMALTPAHNRNSSAKVGATQELLTGAKNAVDLGISIRHIHIWDWVIDIVVVCRARGRRVQPTFHCLAFYLGHALVRCMVLPIYNHICGADKLTWKEVPPQTRSTIPSLSSTAPSETANYSLPGPNSIPISDYDGSCLFRVMVERTQKGLQK
ncbi:hypothetical protein BDN72DRAFT_861635 [Pluteus cervinus]|uniref:Uncharacterized protein n=1 Tax=Pluteus cervinus TaxID=181527 RepID=A0ACD3AEV6_9AGAR|nr:hypothetical protein BDN72DRAFT_861635 [Pluteus cervinus]